jgi:hypothetical protein
MERFFCEVKKKYMKIKFVTNHRLTKTIPIACIFNCLMAIVTFAQTNNSTKAVVKPIDPLSIDITRPTLFAVPYTHLDDMWRWSYPQVIRDFLKNTLDDNFKAFKEYPGYVFNWSGASRYQMMHEYYPEKYEELKEWIAAGRWYPSGSSWVENDVNVPSTESVIRQILSGYHYFKNEFGKESRIYASRLFWISIFLAVSFKSLRNSRILNPKINMGISKRNSVQCRPVDWTRRKISNCSSKCRELCCKA